jgi:hypothetical protein
MLRAASRRYRKFIFYVPFTGKRPLHRDWLYRCFHYGPPEEQPTSELGANLLGWLPSTKRKDIEIRKRKALSEVKSKEKLY